MRPTRINRVKLCQQCQQPAPVLFRLKYGDSKQWVFACTVCLEQLQQQNQAYTYGGTWKALKKH